MMILIYEEKVDEVINKLDEAINNQDIEEDKVGIRISAGSLWNKPDEMN